MYDTRAGKVDCAMAKTPIDAALGQPAAAPEPVRVDAVWQRDPKAIEAEVLPRPALRHRASRNCGSGVHEHHHEEKEHHYGYVIDRAAEEETLCSQ
jgi:hypothetical protein